MSTDVEPFTDAEIEKMRAFWNMAEAENATGLVEVRHMLRLLALVESLQTERDARERLWKAVVAIWRHTEQHTTFIEGVGYTSRSDQQICPDAASHSALAAEEGAAWHEYRATLDATQEPTTCPHDIKIGTRQLCLYCDVNLPTRDEKL